MRFLEPGGRRLAVICGLALALCGCGQGTAQQQLSAARSRLAAGDAAGAAVRMRALLKEQPQSAEAAYTLGLAYAALGDAAAASEAFRMAKAGGFADEQLAPEWAAALLQLGRPEEAIERFGSVELHDPGRAAALLQALCVAQARKGQLPAALASADRALALQPDDPTNLLVRARVVAAQGDVAAARQTVKSVLERQSDNALAWELSAELQQADTNAAIADYRKALRLQPRLASAHAGLIALLLAKPDLAAAAAQQKAMVQLLPRDANALYFGGLIALLGGDAPQAQKTADRLLQMAPEHPQLLMLASLAAARMGDAPAALAWSEQAASAAPLSSDHQIHLARAYFSSGRADQAQDTLKALLARQPDDVKTLAALAGMLQALGDAQEADRLFAKALAINPTSLPTRIAYADALLQRGQTEAGLRELQQGSVASPNGDADLALALAQLDCGDGTAAGLALDALGRKQAATPAALLLRSQLLLRQGDAAGARQALEAVLALDAGHGPAAAGLAELDLGEGAFERARHRLDPVLARQPTPSSALLAQVRVLGLAGGSPEEVIAILERATRLNPKDPLVWAAVIDTQLAPGNPALALKLSQSAAKALPGRADIIERQAAAQSASGQTVEAVATLSQALGQQPDSLRLRLALAEAQLAAGQLQQAADSVKPALALHPELVAVQRTAFNVALRSGQGGAAVAIAKVVQARQPGEALGFRLEGQAQAAQKNWPGAAAAYRKGLDKQNAEGMAARLHAALVEGRQDAQAQQFETNWLQAHPNDASFLNRLGEFALRRQDWAAAEVRFRQVLARQPSDAAAMNNLAVVLLELKKDGALALAERAVRLGSRNPQFKDTLAAAHAQAGQWVPAITQQQQAVELAPKDVPLRLNLARLHQQAGHAEQARSALAGISAADIAQAGLQSLLQAPGR